MEELEDAAIHCVCCVAMDALRSNSVPMPAKVGVGWGRGTAEVADKITTWRNLSNRSSVHRVVCTFSFWPCSTTRAPTRFVRLT